MGDKFNKEAKQGWRGAADAARITDEGAGSKDCKHTSGGVLMAIEHRLGAVVDKEEGAAKTILGNEEESPKRG